MKNRKINETLAELIAGIVIVGILIQLIELLVAVIHPEFAGSKCSFAIGLWIGVITAIFLAAHMYRSIDTALDMQPDDAEKYMRKAYLFRTAVILVVAFLVHFFKLGYVMATFVGMLTLKFGAFLQPLLHKIFK
jgi:sensor histidine kinase regulating citrate/malate metabolism